MLVRRPRIATAAVVAFVVVALAGCGSPAREVRSAAADTSQSASQAPAPTRSPSPSPSATVSASAPVSEPASPSASVPPTGPVQLSDRLLTAEEMPGFNAEWTWQVAQTRDGEGDEPFGTCHKFAMTSLGASRVVVRTFEDSQFPDSPAVGSQLVAEFPDEMTARRAFEVLKSWRGQCKEELRAYDRRHVHGFEEVELPTGVGGWYLLIYGPPQGARPDMAWFDAQGLTRVGRRISVLEMRAVGQDYNYPRGEEPLVAGVERAAAKLA